MKLEKLFKDDVIRENTIIGDVRFTKFDEWDEEGNVVECFRVDCWDENKNTFVSTESLDLFFNIDYHIDMHIPILLEFMKG